MKLDIDRVIELIFSTKMWADCYWGFENYYRILYSLYYEPRHLISNIVAVLQV